MPFLQLSCKQNNINIEQLRWRKTNAGKDYYFLKKMSNFTAILL